MAVRQIILIDEEKCDGCGDCVPACHEGALAIVNGKAKLVSETYCDGLGACLGQCPRGAITIEARETIEYDAESTARHIAMLKIRQTMVAPNLQNGCPGSASRTFAPVSQPHPETTCLSQGVSELRTWPVQLKLVAPNAPFLHGADLLLCADCVPFAVPDFHARFLAGKVLLVGCPKLDDLNFYHLKLMTIFAETKPRSITVLKMEVPCCTGIAQAALHARASVAPDLAASVYTIGINGDIRQERIMGSDAGIPVV